MQHCLVMQHMSCNTVALSSHAKFSHYAPFIVHIVTSCNTGTFAMQHSGTPWSCSILSSCNILALCSHSVFSRHATIVVQFFTIIQPLDKLDFCHTTFLYMLSMITHRLWLYCSAICAQSSCGQWTLSIKCLLMIQRYKLACYASVVFYM